MPAHRRFLSLGLALGLFGAVAAGPPGAAADTQPAIRLPNAGCVTFSDPAGDAAAPWGADSDLDITWAAFTSPVGKIRVFIHLAKLGSPTLIGHIYSASFVFNTKVLKFFGGEDGAGFESIPRDPTGQLGKPLNYVTYDNHQIPDLEPAVVFDQDKSLVILTVDRAPIEAFVKAPLADGLTVTAVGVAAEGDGYTANISADNAPKTIPPAQSTYTIGDNHCVTPPKGVLTLTSPSTSVYGHEFTLSGVLKDETDKVIAGKPVSLMLDGKTQDLTTDPNGAISYVVPSTLLSGGYDLKATFAGDDDLQAAQASVHVDIAAAPTRMTLTSAPSGRSVIVKAVLLNDLKKPMAGQVITWLVDGKVTKTTKTDATGKATFTTAPRHSIKASFAGVSRRYLGTSATKRI